MPRTVRDFGKEVAHKQNCDNRTQVTVGKNYQRFIAGSVTNYMSLTETCPLRKKRKLSVNFLIT